MCLNTFADMELSDMLKVNEEISMQARRRSQAGRIISMPGGVSVWPDALHHAINNLAVNTKSLQLKFVDDIKIGRVVNNEAVTRNWMASLAGPIPTKYVLIASDAK